MVTGDTIPWAGLERWSPRLFLAAGAILVVYASLNGLWAFAEMATRDSGFEFGYVLGFLGLLGLYPSLRQRSPRLARIGAVGAAAGILGITAISAVEVAQLGGIVSGAPPGWWLFVFLSLAGFMLGYLSFGAAILRAGRYPATIGVLVSIPGAIVVLMVVHIVAGLATDLTAFVISAGEAMAHLAIGATLRTKDTPSDSEAPADVPDRELMANE